MLNDCKDDLWGANPLLIKYMDNKEAPTHVGDFEGGKASSEISLHLENKDKKPRKNCNPDCDINFNIIAKLKDCITNNLPYQKRHTPQ